MQHAAGLKNEHSASRIGAAKDLLMDAGAKRLWPRAYALSGCHARNGVEGRISASAPLALRVAHATAASELQTCRV